MAAVELAGAAAATNDVGAVNGTMYAADSDEPDFAAANNIAFPLPHSRADGENKQQKQRRASAHQWDPRSLLANKLYKVDYNPLVENRPRFKNMEGHLEIPNDDEHIVEPVEKRWKKLYFRTKEGRLQWYATHFADEHPISDVLLTGTNIAVHRNDWTIVVQGGKERVNVVLRVPSGVYEKWRQALLSHAHSALIDAYVQPVYPPVPHYTQRVVLIELGTCSVRAGILTNKPSLPFSMFPAVGCVGDDGKVHACGIDAFAPEAREKGHLESWILPFCSTTSTENLSSKVLETAQQTDGVVERYQFNKAVFEACIRKVLADLNAFGSRNSYRFDFSKNKALLSVPQDIPAGITADLLRTLLAKEFGFQTASVARQPSLALYSYEVTTGVVVDIGERLSVVPVVDEYIVEGAVFCVPFGAQQIRTCLRRRLDDGNNGGGLSGAAGGALECNTALEQIVLRYLAEQVCYVAADYDDEKAEGRSTKNGALENVVLFDAGECPPGMEHNFRVNNVTRFHVTEGLFKPDLWGMEMKGLHQLVHDAIQQAPIDSRRTLYRNIFLSGGTSLLPGLAERLEQELNKIAPSSIFVQVLTSPWRYHSAYLGAQVLASTLQFDECCTPRDRLDDYIRRLSSGQLLQQQ